MKKLLALVLAMVMTLGLATVGTNAVDKFADNDSIKFTEAATVMKAIGVFDGDDNGNFRPTDTLKRSEAAKIVAYLMLTKKTADGLIPSGTRYVDVPANHWAAGYIEYLTSEGVLGGVGNGMFNPDGDITGIDFAKMLLVALGYDAKLENLVLSDYRINTAKLANSIELFEGNTDMVPTAAITRDEAVLYSFNMIKSPMMEYDSNVRVDTGNGSVVTVGNNRAYQKTSDNSTRQTILYKQAYRNDKLNGGLDYIVEFAEEKYPDLQLYDRNPNDEKDNGIGSDAFGRPARKWLWKNEDLGTFVQTQDLVATWNNEVKATHIYEKLGKTVYDSLKDDYSKLVVREDARVLSAPVDSNSSTKDWVNVGVDYFVNRDSGYNEINSGNGSVTELYMDKDKNVTIVTMHTWVYQATADYNKNARTLNITPVGLENKLIVNQVLKLEDFPEIENYKADDYILVHAKKLNTGDMNFEIKEIEKADLLTAKVEAYTSDGNYSVTMDGTKHNYAYTSYKYLKADGTFAEDNDAVRKTSYSVGKEATVVVDKNGYIYAIDEAIVTSDFVFISEFGSTSGLKNDAVAAAYFTDGTDATIKLKAVETSAGTQIKDKTTISGWAKNPSYAGKWYTWSKNSNNEYTLYMPGKNYSQVSGTYTGAGDRYQVMNDGAVMFLYTGNAPSDALRNSKANDKTVVVVNNAKDELNVYVGVKNVPGIVLTPATNGNASTAKVYVLNKTTGSSTFASVVYVDMTGAGIVTGSANDKLVYVVEYHGDQRTEAKNETVYNYTVLKNDGTKDTEDITADNRIQPGKSPAATGSKIYAAANYASKNADGLYTNFYNASDDNAASDTVRAGYSRSSATQPIVYKNGALTLGGEGWTIGDDAKITMIALGSASVLNEDKAASWEPHPWITAQDLSGRLSSVKYTYDFAIRTESSLDSRSVSGLGNRVIKEAYVTVYDAVQTSTTVSNIDGLSVEENKGVLTVYDSRSTSTATADEALTAIDVYFALNGYTYDNDEPTFANGEYNYYNVRNELGYVVGTWTYTPTAATPNTVAIIVNGGAPVKAVSGTGYTVSGKTLTADGAKYVSVDGSDYSKSGTYTLQPYSTVNTKDIQLTIDSSKLYLNAGDKLDDYVGTGTYWKDTTSDKYVAYKNATAPGSDATYVSGYIKVSGDIDVVQYVKAGTEAKITIGSGDINDSYTVTDSANAIVADRVTGTYDSTDGSTYITVNAGDRDLTVGQLLTVAVTDKDGLSKIGRFAIRVNGTTRALDSGKLYVKSDDVVTFTWTASGDVSLKAGDFVKITAAGNQITALTCSQANLGTVSMANDNGTFTVKDASTMISGSTLTASVQIAAAGTIAFTASSSFSA